MIPWLHSFDRESGLRLSGRALPVVPENLGFTFSTGGKKGGGKNVWSEISASSHPNGTCQHRSRCHPSALPSVGPGPKALPPLGSGSDSAFLIGDLVLFLED